MCVHSKAKTTGRRFRCRMFIGVATVTLGVFVKFTRRLRLRRVRIPVQACALRGRTALIHDAVRPRKDCFGGSLSSPRTTWVGLNKLPTIAEEPRSMKQSTARPPNPSVKRTNTGGLSVCARPALCAPAFAAYLRR